MKYLLLSLPLALMACVKPDCVVYVNGKPVYNQCYQHDSESGGNAFTPPTVNEDDRDPTDNGNNSTETSNDSNGDNSNENSDDSNGDNSDDRSDDNGSDSSDR